MEQTYILVKKMLKAQKTRKSEKSIVLKKRTVEFT